MELVGSQHFYYHIEQLSINRTLEHLYRDYVTRGPARTRSSQSSGQTGTETTSDQGVYRSCDTVRFLYRHKQDAVFLSFVIRIISCCSAAMLRCMFTMYLYSIDFFPCLLMLTACISNQIIFETREIYTVNFTGRRRPIETQRK